MFCYLICVFNQEIAGNILEAIMNVFKIFVKIVMFERFNKR